MSTKKVSKRDHAKQGGRATVGAMHGSGGLACFVVLAALLLAACGDDDSGVECSAADRSGLYIMHMEWVSGDCGAPPADALVSADGAGGPPEIGCTRDSDKWTDDECGYELVQTCVDSSTGDVYYTISKTTQEDDDADTISGIITLTVRDSGGFLLCLGTYDLLYTRQ